MAADDGVSAAFPGSARCNADGKGFPDLVASYDADNKTVDAGATAAKTSVWFVKFGERDVQFVFGEHTPLKVSDRRVESLVDANGKTAPKWEAQGARGDN